MGVGSFLQSLALDGLFLNLIKEALVGLGTAKQNCWRTRDEPIGKRYRGIGYGCNRAEAIFVIWAMSEAAQHPAFGHALGDTAKDIVAEDRLHVRILLLNGGAVEADERFTRRNSRPV